MHAFPTTALIYAGAALAEIVGCFAFWTWLRQGQSPLWVLAGIPSLIAFAWLLTLAPAEHAGRTYAAYGGVYIVSAEAIADRSSHERSKGECAKIDEEQDLRTISGGRGSRNEIGAGSAKAQPREIISRTVSV